MKVKPLLTCCFSGMSSSAVCLDASHDLLVVGHANGFIAVYQKPTLPERITKNKIRFLKPTKSWRAHIRPITTISINPSNVSATFPRSSKGKNSCSVFPTPMPYSREKMANFRENAFPALVMKGTRKFGPFMAKKSIPPAVLQNQLL